MATTKTFKLTTGVECEIKKMTGVHKEALSQNGGTNFNNGIEMILQDCTLRVGSVQKPSKEFIEKMLPSDRKQIVVEVACFTIGYKDEFWFDFEYISDIDGKDKKEPIKLDISNGFPIKPLMILKDGVLIPAEYNEYDEIQREYCTKLPESGEEIFWQLLSAENDKKFKNVKKQEQNVFLFARKRMPYRWYTTEKGGRVKITVDNYELQKMDWNDSEALMKDIRMIEPDFITTCKFKHPEDSSTVITKDITDMITFFYPSWTV